MFCLAGYYVCYYNKCKYIIIKANRFIALIQRPKKTRNVLRVKYYKKVDYEAKKLRLPGERLRDGRLRFRLKLEIITNASEKRFTLRVKIKGV